MKKLYGLLTIIILLLSTCSDAQSRRNKRNTGMDNIESGQNTVTPSGSVQDTIPVNVNIYIENSASMDGYVNGETEFKNAIGQLLVDLKFHYEEEHIKLYYISEDVYPVDIELSLFVEQLSPQTLKTGRKGGSTNLNNIFGQILEKTDNNTVSVLISDCIYSIKGTNATELLSREKNTVKDVFMSKSKTSGFNLAINILQFHSKFRGTYYTAQNHKVQLNNRTRPYYICMTGNAGLLPDFNSKIRYAELRGFQNNVFLDAEDYSSAINYTVLKATGRQGKFTPVKSKDMKYYTGMKDTEAKGRNFEFGFALALNLKPLPVSGSLLDDTATYMVTEGNFSIENIYSEIKLEAADKIDPVIKNAIKEMSHIIVFKATKRAFSNLSFAMKKAVSLPRWVEEANTEDDSDIKDNADEETLGKTFGIKYMIEGIAEAYQEIFRKNYPGKALDKYFEIEIPIN